MIRKIILLSLCLLLFLSPVGMCSQTYVITETQLTTLENNNLQLSKNYSLLETKLANSEQLIIKLEKSQELSEQKILKLEQSINQITTLSEAQMKSFEKLENKYKKEIKKHQLIEIGLGALALFCAVK